MPNLAVFSQVGGSRDIKVGGQGGDAGNKWRMWGFVVDLRGPGRYAVLVSD